MTASTRPLNVIDLAKVSSIHLQAFPGSALTHLGHEAVRRYYEWLLTGPHDAVKMVAINDEEIVGFCFCGKFRGALSGFIKTNRFFLMRRVAIRPWMIFSEEFRTRLMLGLRLLIHSSPPSAYSQPSKDPVTSVSSFGILAIAVSPAAQGTGAGKLLMNEAERVARERGFTRMNLSVSTKNLQAIVFYERLGWQKVMEGGEWRGQMDKNLGS